MNNNNYKNPIIFFHSRARNGKSSKNFQNFISFIQKKNIFNNFVTFKSGHLDETRDKILAIHQNNEHDLIISFGGDGTISSICNGLMEIEQAKRLPLLPIPGGSGNSILKDFEIFNKDHAIDRYRQNRISYLDVIEVKEKNSDFCYYCLNILGMGFITDITRLAEKDGKWLGGFSYILSTLLSLKKFKPYKTEITYNSLENSKTTFKSDKVFFLSISNTRYTGGNIQVAPEAKYDDGIMDLIILHNINRRQFLNGFFKNF